MSLVDVLIGEGVPKDGKFHLRAGSEDLQKMEGRFLRFAFVAAALALATVHVADSFDPPAQPAAEEKRVLPAPLL